MSYFRTMFGTAAEPIIKFYSIGKTTMVKVISDKLMVKMSSLLVISDEIRHSSCKRYTVRHKSVVRDRTQLVEPCDYPPSADGRFYPRPKSPLVSVQTSKFCILKYFLQILSVRLHASANVLSNRARQKIWRNEIKSYFHRSSIFDQLSVWRSAHQLWTRDLWENDVKKSNIWILLFITIFSTLYCSVD